MNTNWIEAESKGKRVAKCDACGWNSAPHHIGSDRACPNCEDILEDARLSEQKVARWEAMSAALPVVEIGDAPSIFSALQASYFGAQS